jgi:3-deoxy-D-manno-octulosonate 8-phosphate phosphatase (KDO 8-P phosphatase)
LSGAKGVRGLVFDVDGVLTDGTVEISSSGAESKRFSIQDGTALLWCRLLGYELALVSGRQSGATSIRAAELGIDEVYQGVRDKAARVTQWAGSKGLALDEVLYMGDDHIDLPVFDVVGVSVAPANADPHVRARATHVTTARGGDGAVREAIEWLLAEAGRLDEALAAYRERFTGEAGGSAQ